MISAASQFSIAFAPILWLGRPPVRDNDPMPKQARLPRKLTAAEAEAVVTRILEAMGADAIPADLDRAELRGFIQRVPQVYRTMELASKTRRQPKDGQTPLEKASKLATKLHELLAAEENKQALRRVVARFPLHEGAPVERCDALDEHEDLAGSPEPSFLGLIAGLKLLSDLAAQEAGMGGDNSSPPITLGVSSLEWLIGCHLSGGYERFFEKKAGYTRSPVTDIVTENKFVTFALGILHSADLPGTADTIAKAVLLARTGRPTRKRPPPP